MAAAGNTPIQLYYSNTAGHIPTAANLISGELAINMADGLLFYKNSSNNVITVPTDTSSRVNVAFARANAAFAQANAAFEQANTGGGGGGTTDTWARGQANSAFAQANAAFAVANTGGGTGIISQISNTTGNVKVITETSNVRISTDFGEWSFEQENDSSYIKNQFSAIQLYGNTIAIGQENRKYGYQTGRFNVNAARSFYINDSAYVNGYTSNYGSGYATITAPTIGTDSWNLHKYFNSDEGYSPDFMTVKPSSNTILATGYSNNYSIPDVIISSDYGLTWNKTATLPPTYDGLPGTYLNVSDMHYNSSLDRWTVVGADFSTGYQFYVVTSDDNGQTWTKRGAGTYSDVRLEGITYGNGTYVAVGYRTSNTTIGLTYTSSNGNTWTEHVDTIVRPSKIVFFNGLFFRTGYIAYTGSGSDFVVQKSTDGVSWTTVLNKTVNPPSSPWYRNIQFVNWIPGTGTGTWLAMGYLTDDSIYKPFILRSTDEGSTWVYCTLPNENVFLSDALYTPTFATTVSYVFGVYRDETLAIWSSSDDGVTWSEESVQFTGANPYTISVGKSAGTTLQKEGAVAIGAFSGEYEQGINSVGIGFTAGFSQQGDSAIAIGYGAGEYAQNAYSIAMGKSSGQRNQGYSALAIGYGAGNTKQSNNTVALGSFSGSIKQGSDSISIGAKSGHFYQESNSIAIGLNTGNYLQGTHYYSNFLDSTGSSIAIGKEAGSSFYDPNGITCTADPIEIYVNDTYRIQLSNTSFIDGSGIYIHTDPATANTERPLTKYYVNNLLPNNYVELWVAAEFGSNISIPQNGETVYVYNSQDNDSISIGTYAGYRAQSEDSVAIGFTAGSMKQREFSIAIGYEAGQGALIKGQIVSANSGDNYIIVDNLSVVPLYPADGNARQEFYPGAYIYTNVGTSYRISEIDSSLSNTTLYLENNLTETCNGFIYMNAGQGDRSVAIGKYAGAVSQGGYAIGIGWGAGYYNQADETIAIGDGAGERNQSYGSIAIGLAAGQTSQGLTNADEPRHFSSIAIGRYAGIDGQGVGAIAIGDSAGVGIDLVNNSVIETTYVSGIGSNIITVGDTSQLVPGMYVYSAWYHPSIPQQDNNSRTFKSPYRITKILNSTDIELNLSVPSTTWADPSFLRYSFSQDPHAIAIGSLAGSSGQYKNAIAIGYKSGLNQQGANSIAIGANSGIYQTNNSIVINATGDILNNNTFNSLVIAPIRNDVSNTSNVLYYNTTTKEVTYAPPVGGGSFLPLSGGTITGTLNVTNDLVVQGNLTVLGSQTTINTSSIILNDPLIYLANNNYTSDLVDIGIIGHYNDGANAHTGIIRDPNRKEWIFFTGYTPEVESNNLINIAHPSFAYANVYANTFKGDVQANTITISGINILPQLNAAFTTANTSGSLAQVAFNQANAAFATANTHLPRVVTITDGTSITVNGDVTDLAIQTNTQAAGTLTINSPTGTPTNGQKFMIRVQCTNAQTLSFNAIFAGSTDIALPTATTGSSKYDYMGFIYNSTATKWQMIGKNFGF